MDKQLSEQIEAQRESASLEQAQAMSARSAQQQLEEVLQNPEFLQQLEDPDTDGNIHDWLEDELGPLLSGAHIRANEEEHHRHRSRWLNQNRAERTLSEREPGRLLKEKPYLLSVAQGVHRRDDKDAREPFLSDEKRVVRDAHGVATALHSLGVDATGLESVTTATTEARTVQNKQEEESGIRSKVKGAFR
jgi:hypothetical protein